MSIQPIELPDREIHVFPAKLLGEIGGGGGRGVKINKKFSGGGRIGEFGRGEGVLVRKKFPDLRSPDVGTSATGSITENLYSHAKLKTCSIPDIYEYPVPQEKDDSRIKWLTDIQPLTK